MLRISKFIATGLVAVALSSTGVVAGSVAGAKTAPPTKQLEQTFKGGKIVATADWSSDFGKAVIKITSYKSGRAIDQVYCWIERPGDVTLTKMNVELGRFAATVTVRYKLNYIVETTHSCTRKVSLDSRYPIGI